MKLTLSAVTHVCIPNGGMLLKIEMLWPFIVKKATLKHIIAHIF